MTGNVGAPDLWAESTLSSSVTLLVVVVMVSSIRLWGTCGKESSSAGTDLVSGTGVSVATRPITATLERV